MKLCESLRLLAGAMVLVTVTLMYFVSIHFVWLGVFVGVNLIQSAFSKTCPAVYMLKKCGVQE
ncbi:MAG: DUF2892 domain-containing protein [Candidatus Woesearchaeota archaeon]